MLLQFRYLLDISVEAYLIAVLLATVGVLVGFTIHEASHAAAAFAMGDDTAKQMGRLSLNPLRHLDATGTILIAIAGFGWGKPVPVNPSRLRRDFKPASVIVSVAGVASNFLLVGVLGLLIRSGLLAWHNPFTRRYLVPFADSDLSWILSDVAGYVIVYNLFLGVFNLIPLPPLDGFNALLGFLPARVSYSVARFQQYGFVALMVLFALGWYSDLDILGGIIFPGVEFASRMLIGRPFL